MSPKLLSRVAALLVGIVLAALTLELVAREIYRYPLSIDRQFGYVVRPGVVTWRTEGSGVSRWTVGGLRRSAPPDAVPSLLVLGDSFTEALMVNDADVFTHLLEQTLRASGLAVPVLNAGRSTMSVADYIYHAPYYRRTYGPRWTIVQLRDSDVTDDAWKHEPGVARFERDGGALVVRPPDVAPPTGLKATIFEWRQRSSLLGFGIVRARAFAHAAASEPPLFRAGERPSPPPPASVDYPVEDSVTMLMHAFDERVTLLYLPDYDPRGAAGPTAVERRVAELCARKGWSFVDLRDSFRPFVGGPVAPYGFDSTGFNAGHMNRHGHAVAARALAAEIQRLSSHALF